MIRIFSGAGILLGFLALLYTTMWIFLASAELSAVVVERRPDVSVTATPPVDSS